MIFSTVGCMDSNSNLLPIYPNGSNSMTDTANDLTSGESHKNSFEPTIRMGFGTYRERVTESTASLVSESALMGPHSRQTFEKIFPKEKLWPTMTDSLEIVYKKIIG